MRALDRVMHPVQFLTLKSRPLPMNTDSREYHILERAARSVSGVPGLTCEIGVREGGGTKAIIDAVRLSGGPKKVHVAIDPFGNIEYAHFETLVAKEPGYTNAMKNRMLKLLYQYCEQHGVECLFFPLEDTEYFKRFADGVPLYDQFKTMENRYALVFFDGPHTTALVKTEFDFFKDRQEVGAALVFDDIDQYPHMSLLDPYIRSHGYALVEQGVCKASYTKIMPRSLA